MSDEDYNPRTTVAFQGAFGAFSHLACREAAPDFKPLPCVNFDAAFEAVTSGQAVRGMIAIENSLAGRVADVHHLMPSSNLYIVGEHFQKVHMHMMAPQGTKLSEVKEVHSHVHALAQCRKFLKQHDIKAVVHADTAGACEMVAELGDPKIAAIGSVLAGEIHGLDVLSDKIADHDNNFTRFVVLSRERIVPHPDDGDAMTSFMFEVRSVPAALYKALGGFATNGINITKLESYIEPGSFSQAQFFADIEGHPESKSVGFAFEELKFFTKRFEILGTYPKSHLRF